MTRRWHQAAVAAACAVALVCGQGVHAQGVQPIAPVTWGALSMQQRTTLAPLAVEWSRLAPAVQHKWIEIAGKLPTMSAEQQQRVHERMREWARLSPEQRTEARLNFQQFRQWGGVDKQARWEAYQALPPEERQALAAKAARAASAPASAPMASPTHLLRKAPLGAMVPKSNVVKEAPVPAVLALRPVAPSVVQARPGVTTQWVGVKQPSPPDHQKAGQPKIAAGPGMVDRSTLLPKHGPQAAGVAAPHKPPVVARAGAASAVSPAASSAAVASSPVVGAASAASSVVAAVPVAASAVASVVN
ncbi:DUF3106 domain-containing protein [Vitreoscilla filiformis]|nr:DUF3106 domain-containing protein [Vitreoscilla filiformis]